VRPRYGLVRDLAEKLVRTHGLTPPVNVRELAERLEFIVREEEFEPSLSGMYVVHRRIIAVNRLHSHTRRRFSIAHELGHALLHVEKVEQQLFVDENAVHYRASTNILDWKEIEANRFAANILMPEKAMRKIVPAAIEIYDENLLSLLARQFDTSPQAFTARLAELSLTPEKRKQHLTIS